MYIITFYEGKKKEIIVLKISTRYIERNIDLDEFEIWIKHRCSIAANKYYIFLFYNTRVYLITHSGKLIQYLYIISDIKSNYEKELVKRHTYVVNRLQCNKQDNIYILITKTYIYQ